MKLSNFFKSLPESETYTVFVVSNAFKGNFENKFIEHKFATVDEVNTFLGRFNYRLNINDIVDIASGKLKSIFYEDDKNLIFFTKSKLLIDREFVASINNVNQKIKSIGVPKEPRLSFLVSLLRPANIQSVEITQAVTDSFHMSVKVK